MKKVVILVLIKLFLITNIVKAQQSSYQTFASEGFKVKCDCRLYVNTSFIQLVKKQGINNLLGAYVCAENENNPDIAVIFNININDLSDSYKTISAGGYSQFEKSFLDDYAFNLRSLGYPFSYTTYQGVSALEYSFNQMGMPTKAIIFIKNKKTYLLQVATRRNLAAKYNTLKTSFQFL